MLDLVMQFPILNENASMVDLQEEAVGETRAVAVSHGYSVAGQPVFQVLDLPLGWYLECRVPVEELKFGGSQRGK